MILLPLSRGSVIELLEDVLTADGQELPAGTVVVLDEEYLSVRLDGKKCLIPVGVEFVPDGKSLDGKRQLVLSFSTL